MDTQETRKICNIFIGLKTHPRAVLDNPRPASYLAPYTARVELDG